jgi:hypothetical protein
MNRALQFGLVLAMAAAPMLLHAERGAHNALPANSAAWMLSEAAAGSPGHRFA